MNLSLLKKLGLLGSLYVSQGLPHGFRIAAPIFMVQRGMGLDQVGILALVLYFPWIFKFIWAPLVDRFYSARMGRRRSWIIPMQCLMSLLVMALAIPGEEIDTSLLIASLTFINLVSAIQDTATDGFGVDILEPEERGWGNGIQMGGYWTGYMVGGGLILILMESVGWASAFLTMGSLMALCMIPVLLTREKAFDVAQVVKMGLFSFLRRKGVIRLLLFIMIYRSSDGFIRRWVITMLNEKGYSIGQIGWLQGVAGPLAGLVGALIGGMFAARLGRKHSLVYYGLLQLVPFGLYLYVAAYQITDLPIMLVSVLADHIVASMVIVAVFSFMMDQSAPVHGATDYTFQDCAGVFATILVSVGTGFIAENHGYATAFATGMIMVLLSVASLFLLITPAMWSHERDRVAD
ncbi:MAG: MFS transporter [Acidobacteriota bacterium]|nr:MFS transporter [Acidobacteriota bacterium]